jgi:hypothetical protein
MTPREEAIEKAMKEHEALPFPEIPDKSIYSELYDSALEEAAELCDACTGGVCDDRNGCHAYDAEAIRKLKVTV